MKRSSFIKSLIALPFVGKKLLEIKSNPENVLVDTTNPLPIELIKERLVYLNSAVIYAYGSNSGLDRMNFPILFETTKFDKNKNII